MTYAQVSSYLLRYFYARWGKEDMHFDIDKPFDAKYLLTPVTLINQTDDLLNRVVDGEAVNDGGNEFVQVGVYFDESYQTTIAPVGRRTFERLGFIQCTIYTPIGEGKYRHDELAGRFRDIFEGKRIDSILAQHALTIYDDGRYELSDAYEEGAKQRVDIKVWEITEGIYTAEPQTINVDGVEVEKEPYYGDVCRLSAGGLVLYLNHHECALFLESHVGDDEVKVEHLNLWYLNFDPIIFQAGRYAVAGAASETGTFSSVVTIPFTFDEIK